MPAVRNYPEIAEQYISRVMDGTEIVCKTVRLAVERHVRDLEHSARDNNYPFYFDPIAGARVCKLLELVRPSKWKHKTITLPPWEVCMVTLLYSWKRRADNTRRFRVAFIMLPRKTGKSALLSGFSINALTSDGEPGAEVYSAALTEEQARRVFDESVEMCKGTPELRDRVTRVGDQPCRRLTFKDKLGRKSEFRPLTREKDTIQGTNPSFACCDEVHVWKGRGVWDDIRYGMEARTQPLLIAITTAPSADDQTSICNTLLEYSYKVLEDVIPDDAFFCFITSLDPEDAWDDESKWIKACPNLGVTVKIESMRQMALEAANQPESLNAFKRYSLNIRVDAEDQPIATSDWNWCTRGFVYAEKTDPPKLELEAARRLRAQTIGQMIGRICFAALDLAIINDTSSLVLVFPPMSKAEKWRLLPFFWIPAANIDERVEKQRVPYNVWRDYEFLITTPGKTTDFDYITGHILDLFKLYDIREMAYDPALASGLVKELLTKGLNKDKLVKFAQTAMNYAAPCGDFTRTVVRRELEHDGDPVLRWHITNLRWKRGYTGLIMPDKEKSIEKIDGASASIMGFGRGTHPDNAKLLKGKPSVMVL